MKKLIVVYILSAFSVLSAQETEKSNFFSSFELGAFGGVNFASFRGIGYSYLLELRTNLSHDLNVKLSLGRTSTHHSSFHQRKSYIILDENNVRKYMAVLMNIEKEVFQTYPISLGFEYTVKHGTFSPYGFLELGYNIINSSSIYLAKPNEKIEGMYDTYDQLPSEYKDGIKDSYKLGIGIGTKYSLSSSLNLDFRYLYEFNNEIINTNQLLIGLYCNF